MRRDNLSPLAPGYVIHEELEERGWTQQDLADIMEMSIGRVNGIITARRSMTTKMAIGLGAAFGTGPQFWMKMGNAYKASR